ncbi:unnamed protein product, partial [Closterium sp. NIES-54]
TSPLNSSTPTASTPTAATTVTTATPTAATAAATKSPTLATTPTAAITSTTSTTSTAAPTTTPAATSTTLATLALAAAALPTSRSSLDILSTKDVNSSSRGIGGGKGGGGTPLKEGRARSTTSGTYSDYTSLSCKEGCALPAEQHTSRAERRTVGVASSRVGRSWALQAAGGVVKRAARGGEWAASGGVPAARVAARGLQGAAGGPQGGGERAAGAANWPQPIPFPPPPPCIPWCWGCGVPSMGVAGVGVAVMCSSPCSSSSLVSHCYSCR